MGLSCKISLKPIHENQPSSSVPRIAEHSRTAWRQMEQPLGQRWGIRTPQQLFLVVEICQPVVGLTTLWLFNIAMENGPFIDGLPIKNCDFLWLC